MCRLVMYSDQIEGVTDALDHRLASMLPAHSPKIGYLPASPDPQRSWFSSRSIYYKRLGASLQYFGLEEEFDPSRTPELFECDAIHLTGGNTFQFSYWLKNRGLDSHLTAFARDGGVLIGVSAGAILMTPDISTSFPCGDVAYPALGDFNGLGLVDFAFLPHLTEDLDAFTQFSSTYSDFVYGVPDGSGIVVDGNKLDTFGSMWVGLRGTVDLRLA